MRRIGRESAGILACALIFCVSAQADDRTRAKRIHDRIAGVPPSESVLTDMASDIGSGDAISAAYTAMDNPAFYNATVKNMAAPWTNREQQVFVPLNDYTATVVGMVRDDVGFDTLLSANLIYVGAGGLGLPAYSPSNNDHYQAMEDQGLDLSTALVSDQQTNVTGLPAAAIAGIMSTRAAGEAFFIAGTNRAMFRFTLLNHLCHDLEELKDTSLSPDRIRQDVTRSPGGDSRIFLNNCVGCHTGMDPMAQAFAYYQFDEAQGRVVYTPGQVQPKYFINADNFRPGFVTPDDRWDNYWRTGSNALLGWDPGLPGGGNGAASMGQEMARSDAFAYCQAEKVFETVCLRPPSDAPDRAEVDDMVSEFRSTGYRMKQLFARSAAWCMGD